jgi:tetratricopeptide (TPR) repeat protein
MKKFLLALLCSCIFFNGECQKATQLSITKLHFNSSQEEKIFDAIEKKQSYSAVELFMVIDSGAADMSIGEAELAVNGFAEHLKSEKSKKTLSKTVQNYFDLTHKKFFTKYWLSAYFNEIFESGTYNCVTASALYAILFDKVGIRYTIKETPTHIYLVVNPGAENIMVETTDPQGLISVVTDEMKKQYLDYLKADKLISDADLATSSVNDLFYKSYYGDSDISLIELAGLQYYNKGVDLLDNKQYANALTTFEKSYRLYPCERTSFLILYCLEQFVADDLVNHYDQNKEYLVKYVNYTHKEEARQVVQAYFEKVARELLLNQNDKVHYESFYSYLSENISDSVALADIQFINYFYLGTAEALKSNDTKSLSYFTKAIAINPNNLVLHSLITEVVMQYLSQARNTEAEEVIDSLNHFMQVFPFLSENKNIQNIYAYLYLQLAGENFNRNKADAGTKYISMFELFYKDHPDTELKDNLIGWAYGEESSYYIRKGNKPKAKQRLETGLKYSPNNEQLKTKLSYLKYF